MILGVSRDKTISMRTASVSSPWSFIIFFVPIVVPSNKICLEAVFFYKFAELIQTLDLFILSFPLGIGGTLRLNVVFAPTELRYVSKSLSSE